MAHLEGAISRLEHGFEESSKSAAARWIAEIDAKGTETVHTTFESLFKSADWYEKKVQTQMQNTLEKGVEQISTELRDKAREFSALFATEMDHYSRSFVEHTHGQIHEIGRQAAASFGQEAAEIASSSSATIARESQSQTEATLSQFHNKSSELVGQMTTQIASSAAETRTRFASEFRAALIQDAQQALRTTRQELGNQAESAKEVVRAEGRREGEQLQQSLQAAGLQGLDAYRTRLENTSNSWLLTTAAKLNQQSDQQLEAAARAAEARLRETCSQVFASVGDSLRRRLLDLAPEAAPIPIENRPDTAENK